MHVCFVCNEYPPLPHGGTGTSYHDLARQLVLRGHRVTVIGVHDREQLPTSLKTEENADGVRVIRLTPGGDALRYRLGSLWKRHRLSASIRRLHRENPFDVIEASDYSGWLLFPTPRRVPRIVRLRGSNLFFDALIGRAGDPWEHRLERASLKRATHYAAVSHYVASHLHRLLGENAPCEVLHNAVDSDRFQPRSNGEIVPGRIVFVNSIAPKKGVVELLAAFGRIASALPHVTLELYGAFPRGKDPTVEESGLLTHVPEHFRNRVFFKGRIDHLHLPDALASAEACCFPSHIETFGIAVIEAMAMEKRVIFSNTGPGPELIEDSVSGLLCDPHDPADIERALLVALDPARLPHLGANARARVKERFEMNRWVDRNIAFFTRCKEQLQRGST